MTKPREISENSIEYGPNSKIQNIGFIVFMIGIFFAVLLFLLSFGILVNSPSLFVASVIVDPSFLGTALLIILCLSIGYWMMTSGAHAIMFTSKELNQRKFYGRTKYPWVQLNDRFKLLIRSSQPVIRGRKGLETWDVEIQFTPRTSGKSIKLNVPTLDKEERVARFIINLKSIVNAIPVNKQISISRLVGKTTQLNFEIKRTSVKNLQKKPQMQKGKKIKN